MTAIEQNSIIWLNTLEECFGRCIDADLRGKSMAMKSLTNINTMSQLLYGQNESLRPQLCMFAV